jgi:type IV secretion system protein VirD4
MLNQYLKGEHTGILVSQVATVLGTALGGVWASTQLTAAALGYQSRLGAHWFEVLSTPVYAPWMLFEWWYFYGAYAPEVFLRGGVLAAASGVVSASIAIGMAVWRARTTGRVTTYGSAQWADRKTIAMAGLMRPHGVFLGHTGEPDAAYLRHGGPEHVLACAPTRTGKGVGLVVPTLLTWPGSAVIHDIKGENWHLTAGWRERFSHCLLFNPTDVRSAANNPLLEVRRGMHEVRDVQNIADMLVDPQGGLERRDHWEKTSHSLLVGAILHVLYACEDKSLHGLANFLSNPACSFEATLRRMLHTPHLSQGSGGGPRPGQVHPVVASTARELLNKSENERSGVLSTAVSFLALYRDPIVARVTSHCDWRIQDLIASPYPVSLYLGVPPSDLVRTRPLIRLMLNQIGRRLTESLDEVEGAERKHKLLFMLDEFPALGRLDFFESALAFMAGYGLRAYLIAHSLNQLDKTYGQNHSILDNCHVRVAFATNDERTAKRLSEALGTATELRAQRNYAGHRLAPWLAHLMVSRQETARPLLTPGEVMQLPADEALVMVSGYPPIKAKKLVYYDDRNFVRRLRAPPPLSTRGYADRPASRPDDWSAFSPLPAMEDAHGTVVHPGLGGEGAPRTSLDVVAEMPLPESQDLLQGFEDMDDIPSRAPVRQRPRASVARTTAMDADDGIVL